MKVETRSHFFADEWSIYEKWVSYWVSPEGVHLLVPRGNLFSLPSSQRPSCFCPGCTVCRSSEQLRTALHQLHERGSAATVQSVRVQDGSEGIYQGKNWMDPRQLPGQSGMVSWRIMLRSTFLFFRLWFLFFFVFWVSSCVSSPLLQGVG